MVFVDVFTTTAQEQVTCHFGNNTIHNNKAYDYYVKNNLHKRKEMKSFKKSRFSLMWNIKMNIFLLSLNTLNCYYNDFDGCNFRK